MKHIFQVMVLILFVSGCAFLHKHTPTETTKVYTYNQPFDLIYLRTMEALNGVDDWMFNITNKEKGIIEIRNLKYANLFDLDGGSATFVITDLGPGVTSVEIDMKNSKCKDDCQKLLDTVDHVLSQLPSQETESEKASVDAKENPEPNPQPVLPSGEGPGAPKT